MCPVPILQPAGLAVVTGASLRPVQLRLGDGELATVSRGFGPAGLVASRVAEDPAREHDKGLGGGVEVHIPAGLVKDTSEGLGEFAGCGFVGSELQDGPDVRLVRRVALDPVPAARSSCLRAGVS